MSGGVMVMAGGTGGHVFPALAVAEALRERGVFVSWLGSRDSFESRVVPEHGFDIHLIDIKGLRGKGLMRWLIAPFKLTTALFQARGVLKTRKPQVVLGMGGFVAGPGGLMAKLLGIPLVIHEQNAVPGMTNNWLAKFAVRVFEAFPNSFAQGTGAVACGNPVRRDIVALDNPELRMRDRQGPVRLLVIGGSLGAQALNEAVPTIIAGMDAIKRPVIRHQAGRDKADATRAAYSAAGVDAEVTPFIKDMAEAYGWADLVICRSGALTVSELAAAGVGSLLVPYPYAVDDHQTKNAGYLVNVNAAKLVPQSELEQKGLSDELLPLFEDREQLIQMAAKARSVSMPDATKCVADYCEEIMAR
ncbi:undecaprenyldiphospho-muramoylpentapeptide beta-N-acetylglucosaminyltransferase [Sedimenticola selenatireducens]|nr:undecaprenyldiphospho-muramoylpentapeptide beta-N-acetylglucosaminyltransferase [Sedimenticola selenatireducens]